MKISDLPEHAPWAQSMAQRGVVAVVVASTLEGGLRAIDTMVAAGITAFEVALRTPASMKILQDARRDHPAVLLGAGTVWQVEQVDAVAELGVDFAVSPGTSPEILARAASRGLPFAPGVMTPSDIETALRHGARVMKYFPADTAGGLRHLERIAAPFRAEGISFIPLGGVDETSLPLYLQHPLVLAVGGSWLAPERLIESGDSAEILRRSIAAVAAIQSTRP
jgi:2-dehydro-3-deoxyphosphogluconate aldolase/(4S)-4-hydroxy-2-oxoglutarate aldolase